MEIIDTEIKDVKILKPQVFGDERGFFMETWRDSFFRENVADKAFVQDNHSKWGSWCASSRERYLMWLLTSGRAHRPSENT